MKKKATILLVVATIFATKITAQSSNAEIYLNCSAFGVNSAWKSGGILAGIGIEGKVCDGLSVFAEFDGGLQLNNDRFKRPKKTTFAFTSIGGIILGGWESERSSARIELFTGFHSSVDEISPLIGGGLNFKLSERMKVSIRAAATKGTIYHDFAGSGELSFAYRIN